MGCWVQRKGTELFSPAEVYERAVKAIRDKRTYFSLVVVYV
jgi:hypothetical protein